MAKAKADNVSVNHVEQYSSPSPIRGEIVPVRNDYPPLDASTPAVMWPSNLDTATPRGKALVLAATQVPDLQLDGQGKAHVRATHWLVYPEERENEETGEMEQVVFTCFFDREGRIFKTTGVYARSAIRAAQSLFGAEEWARGIDFVISSRLTRNQRIAHDVRVLLEGETL